PQDNVINAYVTPFMTRASKIIWAMHAIIFVSQLKYEGHISWSFFQKYFDCFLQTFIYTSYGMTIIARKLFLLKMQLNFMYFLIMDSVLYVSFGTQSAVVLFAFDLPYVGIYDVGLCRTVQGNALADRLILDVFLGTCLQEHGQINNGFLHLLAICLSTTDFLTLYILNGAEQVFNVAISVLHNGTFVPGVLNVQRLQHVSLFDVGTIDVVLVIDKAKLLAIYDMHNPCGKHYQYHTNYF
ncbi:hypothetical protein ACJX0J_032074, partial [Zea mays]